MTLHIYSMAVRLLLSTCALSLLVAARSANVTMDVELRREQNLVAAEVVADTGGNALTRYGFRLAWDLQNMMHRDTAYFYGDRWFDYGGKPNGGIAVVTMTLPNSSDANLPLATLRFDVLREQTCVRLEPIFAVNAGTCPLNVSSGATIRCLSNLLPETTPPSNKPCE